MTTATRNGRRDRRNERLAAVNGHQPEGDQSRALVWEQSTHDDDAERVVLGCVMADETLADVVTPHLSSSMFYRPQHATIYRALVAAYASGDPTEPVAIAGRLAETRELAEVGGIDYLRRCLAVVPAGVKAEHYALKVAKKAKRRASLAATVGLQHALLHGDPDKARTYLDELTRLATTQGDHGLSDMLVDGGSFVLDIPSTIPAVWGSGEEILWAEGEALMICGPSGVGKTTITGQLLRALLGLTTKVLGWEVRPAKRVLYLAMDRPAQIRRALGRVFTAAEREVLDERVVFWKGPPPFDLATRPETLLELARAANADVVIVDSLKDAAIGLSEDAIGAGYNRARQAVLADDRQILELHHVVKKGDNGGSPNELKDVYGSAHLINGAGSVIMLWGNAGDPVVEFKHLKQPMSDCGPFRILHDSRAGTSTICEGVDLLEIARRCTSTGLSASDAAAALFEKEDPTRNEVEKARRKLEKLTRQNLLIQKGGGRGGPGGSNSARWFAAAPRSWVPDGALDDAA